MAAGLQAALVLGCRPAGCPSAACGTELWCWATQCWATQCWATQCWATQCWATRLPPACTWWHAGAWWDRHRCHTALCTLLLHSTLARRSTWPWLAHSANTWEHEGPRPSQAQPGPARRTCHAAAAVGPWARVAARACRLGPPPHPLPAAPSAPSWQTRPRSAPGPLGRASRRQPCASRMRPAVHGLRQFGVQTSPRAADRCSAETWARQEQPWGCCMQPAVWD